MRHLLAMRTKRIQSAPREQRGPLGRRTAPARRRICAGTVAAERPPGVSSGSSVCSARLRLPASALQTASRRAVTRFCICCCTISDVPFLHEGMALQTDGKRVATRFCICCYTGYEVQPKAFFRCSPLRLGFDPWPLPLVSVCLVVLL